MMVGRETRFCFLFLSFFFSVTPRAPCGGDYRISTFQFLDIPSDTRDLTRHLEDLTRLYPVEAIERKSLRFCEALGRWRGKPQLEKVSPHLHSASTLSSPSPPPLPSVFLFPNAL